MTNGNWVSAPRNGHDSHKRDHGGLKAILFDLDGTLVDTMAMFGDIAARVLHHYAGMEYEFARSKYLQTSGIPFFAQLQVIVPNHENIAIMNSEFERQKSLAAKSIQMSNRTTDALRELKRLGLGIAISSNNYQNNVETFSQSSPVKFDFALGYSSSLQKGRSHVNYALQHYNCREENLLFVGDSLNDASIAFSCRLKFVAVTQTFPAHQFALVNKDTFCIPSVADLPGLLSTLV